MNLRHRPRLVAAVGAVLAAGTVTAMALTAGTASADEPGRCTQNVNVREDPDAHAKIVALCERGKEVKIGEERNGFVHLDELGGWASKDFVKADDSADDHSADDHGSDADEHHSADDAHEADDAHHDSGDAGDAGDSASEGSGDADNGDAGHGDVDRSSHSTVGNGTSTGRGLGGLLG
jgi:hypothetical protein